METPDHRQVDPAEEVLAAGAVLFRVHSHRFGAADYNPGKAPAAPVTRFAFFGSPPVPVLYAAATAEAAISETILHDVPLEGGRIDVDLVQSKILSPVLSTRDLRLLSLHGHGFRRIGAAAEQVTRTAPSRYAETVPWAAVAHAAGFDGIVWMSRHHDTSKAYAFFGRLGDHGDFAVHPDPGSVRAFAFTKDLDWLTRLLAPLDVTITGP